MTRARPALNIERRLQIHIALLVAMGALLLGMGQRDFRLPVLALFSAATGLYFTDWKGWLKLNRNVANGIALIAVVFTLRDFAGADTAGRLMSIANLLIYLQVILLYQLKSIRMYWQLVVLSLLEVVIGSALSAQLVFGVLMLVYMFLAFSTLGVFFVFRETLRHQDSRGGAVPAWADRTGPLGKLRFYLDWLGGILGVTPLPGSFVRHLQPTMFVASAPVQLGEQVLGWPMARRVAVIGSATLALTALLFFFVPRNRGQNMWPSAVVPPQRMVGFSPTVDLGALGEVAEDERPVMQVRFIDNRTGTPYQVHDELLMRGSLLTWYLQGRWTNGYYSGSQGASRGLALSAPPAGSPLVLQQIVLEPLQPERLRQRTSVAFCVYPPFHAGSRTEVTFNPRIRQLVRSTPRERTTFEVLTTGFRHGRQYRIVPAWDEPEPRFDWSLLEYGSQARRLLLQLPAYDEGSRDPLEFLKSEAARVVQESGLPPDDCMGRSRALQSYLLSPRFGYSLQPEIRDPALDPIEDFIRNRPRGHCEYFATALVLMLRSQGIPARMVMGFRGGDWNSVGGFYQVRQLNAHTWVEAHLTSEQVPESDYAYQGPYFRQGYWLLLDPTPPTDQLGMMANTSWFDTLDDLIDYADALWVAYVAGLTRERQDEAIFTPFSEYLETAVRALLDALESLGWRRSGEAVEWLRINWFSWRGGLVAMLLCGLLIGLFRSAQIIGRRLAAWRQLPLVGRTRLSAEVEFYRRLENLLAKHAIYRLDSQTQHEFASSLASHLGNGSSPRVTPLVRRLVAAFYRVRFGHHTLDSNEQESLEQALLELAGVLDGGSLKPASGAGQGPRSHRLASDIR